MGLTAEQVEERKTAGAVNNVKISSSRTVGQILVGNLFTFFNMLCLAVFIWMATVARDFSDVKNMSFIVVIAANTLIGIIQELRAKYVVDHLTLLSAPGAHVLRSGEEQEIPVNEIVLGEIVLVGAGMQICADGILREGEIEVNESQLTGESLPIKKCEGDEVLSGSFVVSGHGKVEVMAVGEDSYINRLAKESKQLKRKPSELIRSLNFIMKVISIIIIPVNIFAFINNYAAALTAAGIVGTNMFDIVSKAGELTSAQLADAYHDAVFPTSTSIVGMIPSGMFLLTSVALAVGIMRLAKKKALVQELYSIERLARVDMLCLDKTGTITDGTMSVKKLDIINSAYTDTEVYKVVASMQFALNEGNQTAVALQNYFGKLEGYKAGFTIPFSSEKKCSAAYLNDKLYVLGAPEFVTSKLDKLTAARADAYTEKGFRCLLLAVNETVKSETDEIPEVSRPVALIAIEDNIKSDCIDTIRYFKESDVDVRVISGDNPKTVSVIAGRVGVENADKFISLHDKTDDEIRSFALDYTVFGRVSPAQKKLLVEIFKSAGHTVAMTGDGINDILAMKESDCSIAMANGSEATRSIANVVLLDSNFGSMPSIVAEGRRVINNIERSSTLFLTKTLFSFMMTLVLLVWQKSFPIDPIQLSFVATFAIGLPSFFMALEPNNNRIKPGFLRNVLKRILPGAIASIVSVIIIMVFDSLGELDVNEEGLKTMCMVTMFFIFMLVACRLSIPFNPLRAAMILTILAVGIGIIIVFPYLPRNLNLFNIFPQYTVRNVSLIIGLVLLSYFLMQAVDWCILNGEKQIKNFVEKKLRKAEKD